MTSHSPYPHFFEPLDLGFTTLKKQIRSWAPCIPAWKRPRTASRRLAAYFAERARR